MLSLSQVEAILRARRRLRDRLLFALLFQTGMWVGQALGLRHEDIVTWERRIEVVSRSPPLRPPRSTHDRHRDKASRTDDRRGVRANQGLNELVLAAVGRAGNRSVLLDSWMEGWVAALGGLASVFGAALTRGVDPRGVAR